ncbi:hypothetical protein [Halomicrococcus gelatinilyticus]|uniref:hypothetical protein n=1 Tax=Halomicrococcus gelatinilyticus TaxID=1702103 RepID=UPI002E0FC08B
MAEVVSAADWPLFGLCLVAATLGFYLDPENALVVAAVILWGMLVVRGEVRRGYEDV